MTLADELGRLAELRANGGLTEEEFVRAKARVMDGAAAAPVGSPAPAINAFRRSRTDQWLGGVCGGLATLTGTEAWLWRLLFSGLFLFAGAGLLLYILLWIFVPRA